MFESRGGWQMWSMVVLAVLSLAGLVYVFIVM